MKKINFDGRTVLSFVTSSEPIFTLKVLSFFKIKIHNQNFSGVKFLSVRSLPLYCSRKYFRLVK